MLVFAFSELATAIVETSADFKRFCGRTGGGGRHRLRKRPSGRRWQHNWGGVVGHGRSVWVAWAVRVRVVVLQTERTSCDGFSPSCERLIVQTGVRYRPIKVFSCKGFSTKLAVVCYPSLAFVVPFCPDDSSHVGKHFRGFLWKARTNYCCH